MPKNVIEFTVITNDNGSTKIVASSMDKLSAEIDSAATKADKLKKKTGELDRNLKGTAGITSNTTKGFAKMSQGMGGLVSVYAGLAANVFALSAAFNFFKRAADVDNLARSQQEFAATTGSSLASVTSSLREASGQLLTFQEAASATAVGLAKGFSPEVLENLAEGARKASTALGRDFADSFDRLVRGVSKAEPELLDELGITLRLEDATRRYAASIGKASKDLTTYERSQAVAIETQRQLNELFGDVTPQDNQFIKLATTFDDLLKAVQSGILPVFTSLASVINNNFGSAVILFGGLAAAVAKTVLPIDDLKKNLEGVFGNASKAFEQAKDELGGLTDAFKDGQKAQKNAFKTLQGSLKSFKGTSKSIDKILAGDTSTKAFNDLERSVVSGLKNIDAEGKATTGKFKGYEKEKLVAVQTAMTQVVAANQIAAKTSLTAWQRFGLGFRVVMTGLKTAAVGAVSFVGKAFGGVGKVLSKAFAPIAIFTSLILIKDFLKEFQQNIFDIAVSTLKFIDRTVNAVSSFFGVERPISNLAEAFKNSGTGEYLLSVQESAREQKALNDLIEKTDEGLKKAVDEAMNLKTAFDNAETGSKVLSVTLNGLSTSPIPGLAKNLAEIEDKGGDISSQFKKLQKLVKDSGPAAAPFVKALEQARGDAQLTAEALKEVQENALKAQAEQKAASEAANDLTRSLTEGKFSAEETLGAIEKLRFQLQAAKDATKDVVGETEAYSETLESITGKSNIQELEKNLRGILRTQAELTAKTQQYALEQKKLAKLGPVTKKFAQANLKILQMDLDLQKEKINAELSKAKLAEATNKAQVRAAATTLALQEQNIKVLEDSIDLYRVANNDLGLLAKSARDALETELSGAIENFILGNETSIKDSLLKLTLGVGKALTKQLSDIATNFIITDVFGIEDPSITAAKRVEKSGADLTNRINALIKDRDAALKKEDEISKAAIEAREAADKAATEQLKTVLKESFESGAMALQRVFDNTDLPDRLRQALNPQSPTEVASEGPKLSPDGAEGSAYTKDGAARLDSGLTFQEVDQQRRLREQKILEEGSERIVAFWNKVKSIVVTKTQEINAELERRYANFQASRSPTGDLGGAGVLAPEPAPFEVDFNGIMEKYSSNAATQGAELNTLIDSVNQNVGEQRIESANQADQAIVKSEEQKMAVERQTSAISQVTVEGAGKICECINAATDRLIESMAAKSEEKPLKGLFEEKPEIDEKLASQGLQNRETGELLQGPPLPGTGSTPVGDQAQAAAGAQGAGFFSKIKGVFGGFSKKISGLFSKEGGFLKGFGDIFKGGLEGFGGLFDGILGKFGGLFQGLLGGGGGGGLGISSLLNFIPGVGPILGGIAGLFGFANGGYTGGFRGLAEGGVVTKPTLGLIGEGKSNEAVVPLPDGKRIPVDMAGTNQQQNNVSVNINMAAGEGSSQTEDSSGPNSALLGRLIAGAVQRELQEQQRPGGVLSPYGSRR